jgi:TonB family protein
MNLLARIPPALRSETGSPGPASSRSVAFFVASILCATLLSLPSQGQSPQQDTQPAPAQTTSATPAQPPAQAPEPAPAQPPTPAQPAAATPAPQPAAPAQSIAPPVAGGQPSSDHTKTGGEVTEEELRQWLVGKQLILRGGYLGDSLTFNEHGVPTGHPAVGSYTLSAVQIDKVHLAKHKVELEGSRYALHFLGALPYEDTAKTIERVKITPKKKLLHITIDREQLIKQKKDKESEKKAKESAKEKKKAQQAGQTPAELAQAPVASSETDAAGQTPPPGASPATTPGATVDTTASGVKPESDSVTGQTAESAADQPAERSSVTYTTSPAHAAQVLREALDRVFSTGIDEKVLAQMPDFWQNYYRAQAAGVDYRPRDPSILRSSAVDQQAKLLSSISPQSNEYAQANGVSGQALYRVVIGADGVPGEIAVERPIGFGLDENAVAAIRKATFQPAVKAGKPVAETLDLAVLFRIYSKRTAVAGAETNTAEPAKPVLPGPYSAKPQ